MAKQNPSNNVEIMTLDVALLIHVGSIALTLSFHALPRWLAAVLGSLLLTWYGSLQHETIHGHPTPWRRINSRFGVVPLTVCIPYVLYRESHLRRHRHEGRYLTHVNRDPESFYWLALLEGVERYRGEAYVEVLQLERDAFCARL
jgi:fatty acid desaturase